MTSFVASAKISISRFLGFGLSCLVCFRYEVRSGVLVVGGFVVVDVLDAFEALVEGGDFTIFVL